MLSGIYYFVDSTKGKDPIKGTCAGGEGSTPEWTIFVYDTRLTGCVGLTVQLPIVSPVNVDGSLVDWGDGSTEPLTTALQSHKYADTGEKIVKYRGPITSINTTASSLSSRGCLKEVRQWGDDATPTSLRFIYLINLVRVAPPRLCN